MCLKDIGLIVLLLFFCVLIVIFMNSVNSGKFIKDFVIKIWFRCNNREKFLNLFKYGVRR